MKEIMKKIWGNIASRVWLLVTASVLVLLIAVNIVSIPFFDVLCVVLNSPRRMEIVDGGEARFKTIEGVDTREKAAAYGNSVTEAACLEGFTLLKNNSALPLAANSKVSIFGKNSVNMATGGSGSGGSSGEGAKTIFDSLKAVGITYNESLVEFYKSDASGKGRDSNPTDLDSGKTVTLGTGETPWSSYNSTLISSCENFKDAAIIVITRIGGEGFDMPRSYLKLDDNEKALIRGVKGMNFPKVIVLLNTANAIELGDLKADAGVHAIMWTGYAGEYGIMALGKLLVGTVSPSGKTVDTYATLDSNPTWNNFGGENPDPNAPATTYSADAYLAKSGRLGYISKGVFFVDEEEGVYVGYRYYETAYAEKAEGNFAEFDYDAVVAYPFGFGLSYTNFEWTLDRAASTIPTSLEKNSKMTLKVKVKNTGSVKGRDVVQLYVTPPHTHGGIEKSAKVLIGFAKTDELAAGAEQTVEITVDSPYAYASYDCYAKSGTAGYIVEKGDYVFTLSTDAHTAKTMTDFTVTVKANADIRYEKSVESGIAVKNLYTGNNDKMLDMDAELSVKLSRGDFKGTWPTTRTTAEKEISADFFGKLTVTEANPNNPNTYSTLPATNKGGNVMMSDLVGKDYDDKMWDEFLDRLTVAEMVALVNKGAFQTEPIARLGVPLTRSTDGPVGWVNFLPGIKESFVGCCKYCCEEVLSSTWNLDRLYDMGLSVGNEGLIGSNGSPFSGWYAPGLNIHRSPMGGRNFEYYSEDPFVSGQMTAAVMKGLADKGVYVTLKHFALNEQETHRSANGVLTWGTEQAMREIYLKGFEIAITTAKENYIVRANGTRADGGKVTAMGVMSSFNRIGARWTGGDYRLCTTILRDEWGFRGLVICDFNTCSHMNVKDMVYAGGDLNLEMANMRVWNDPDAKSAADVSVLRAAAKNIIYTVANSNAYRGAFVMHMPVWQIVLIVIDCLIVAGLAAWGVFTLLKVLKKQEE